MKSNPILTKFLKKNIVWLAVILIFTALSGFSRTVGASYIQTIVNRLEANSFKGVVMLVVEGYIFMFMAYFLRCSMAICCRYFTEKLSLETRIKLLEHLEKIPFIKYETYTTGNLQSVIRNDVSAGAELIYNLFSRILNNVFLFIFSAGYLLYVNAPLGALIIAFMLTMAVVNQKILKRLKSHQKEIRKSIGTLTSVVENTYNSIETIKTYSALDYILGLIRKEKQVYNSGNINCEKIDAVRLTLYNLANNLTIYGSVVFLGYKAIKGDMAIGDVVVFVYLIRQMLIPVEVIFRWMSNIVSSTVAWSRVYELLDVKEETFSEPQERDISELGFSNLKFSYDGSKNIINNLSFSIKRGMMNGLVGQSGSGKSTLIKILLSLYEGDFSEFFINGKPSKQQDLRGSVCLSPAGKHIFNISIYENLSLGNESITRERCLNLAKELGIFDWIASLPQGLDTLISENASNISGGQCQTLVNMRAFLSDKPVIILDEPFSALDRERETLLLSYLQRIKKDKLILVTSHRSTTLDALDCVVELK